MIDNPNAYLVAQPYGHEAFEEWLRRRLHNPAIRLSLVDSAVGMPMSLRSELYRLVTTPLVRDSDEWQLLKRSYELFAQELPGPPDVADRAFRSIGFNAPYERYILPFRDAAPGTAVEPVEGGIRFTATGGASDPCATLGRDGEHAGVQVPVNGLAAARFDLTLIDPENILGLYVVARTETNRAIRWRWELDPAAQQFGFSSTVTLVPGYSAHRLCVRRHHGEAGGCPRATRVRRGEAWDSRRI